MQLPMLLLQSGNETPSLVQLVGDVEQFLFMTVDPSTQMHVDSLHFLHLFGQILLLQNQILQ